MLMAKTFFNDRNKQTAAAAVTVLAFLVLFYFLMTASISLSLWTQILFLAAVALTRFISPDLQSSNKSYLASDVIICPMVQLYVHKKKTNTSKYTEQFKETELNEKVFAQILNETVLNRSATESRCPLNFPFDQTKKEQTT